MEKTRFLIILFIVILVACVFRISGGRIEGFETPAPPSKLDLANLKMEDVMQFNKILDVYSHLNDKQKIEFMNRIYEIAQFIHKSAPSPAAATTATTAKTTTTTHKPYVPLTTQRPIQASFATTLRPVQAPPATTMRPVQAPPATTMRPVQTSLAQLSVQAPPSTTLRPVQGAPGPVLSSSITPIPFK